jgi:hypothetical protein
MDDEQRKAEIAAAKARLAELEKPLVSAKETARHKRTAVFVFGTIAVLALLALGQCGKSSPPVTPSETAKVGATPSTPATPVSPWTYHREVDPLNDRVTSMACVTSKNLVVLQPPYRPVYVDLCIRNRASDGLNAFVQLQGDGQFMCRSYESCTVKIRFDKQPAANFSAIGPADNSSNAVFINNASRLLSGVKTAETTLVSATFYQAGTQTIEFPTKGLVWPPAEKP